MSSSLVYIPSQHLKMQLPYYYTCCMANDCLATIGEKDRKHACWEQSCSGSLCTGCWTMGKRYCEDHRPRIA